MTDTTRDAPACDCLHCEARALLLAHLEREGATVAECAMMLAHLVGRAVQAAPAPARPAILGQALRTLVQAAGAEVGRLEVGVAPAAERVH